MYKVKLRVNDFITVDLDIPKEMDVSQFEALSSMVKTLGKIPSYSSATKKAASKMQKNQSKKKEWVIPDSFNRGSWKPSELQIIQNAYDPKQSIYYNAQAIAESKQINRTAKQIYSKLKYMNQNNPVKFKNLKK